MKRMLRWEVPVDLQPHQVDVAGTIRTVEARALGDAWRIDMWSEVAGSEYGPARTFQVYGTGWDIPDGAIWIGTAPRTTNGYVWHLYEHPQEAP